MSAEVKPIEVELCFRKNAAKVRGRSLVPDPAAEAELPDVPDRFKPMRGAYGDVARRASQLNEMQLRSGFLHYLFWPETISTPKPKDPGAQR